MQGKVCFWCKGWWRKPHIFTGFTINKCIGIQMGFKLNRNQLADMYAKNLKVFSFSKFILPQLSYLEMFKSVH